MGGGKRLTAVSFIVGSPGDSVTCVMQIWGTSVCIENRKSSRTPRKRIKAEEDRSLSETWGQNSIWGTGRQA